LRGRSLKERSFKVDITRDIAGGKQMHSDRDFDV